MFKQGKQCGTGQEGKRGRAGLGMAISAVRPRHECMEGH